MKKLLALTMIILMIITLGACTEKKTEGEPTDTGDNIEARSAFSAIIAEINENYNPGTAGSSLVAIKYAAMILDNNAEGKLSSEEISKCVSDYTAEMTEDDKAIFIERINNIYTTALELCTDRAEDLLSSAGYEASSAPWDTQTVETLFTSIYAGLGTDKPEIK